MKTAVEALFTQKDVALIPHSSFEHTLLLLTRS